MKFRVRWVWICALVTTGLALQVSCDNESEDSCSDGTPGCRCYGNGTCNEGLTCGPAGVCGGTNATGGSGGAGPGAGGEAGNPGADGGTGGTASGSYMDNCNADFTCWGAGGYGMYELGAVQLRQVGGDCLLGAGSPSVVLNQDGSTATGNTWRVDDNGTLLVCDEHHVCWYVCRTDTVVKFPCSGSAPKCVDLPESACNQIYSCNWSSSSCSGYIYACDVWWIKLPARPLAALGPLTRFEQAPGRLVVSHAVNNQGNREVTTVPKAAQPSPFSRAAVSGPASSLSAPSPERSSRTLSPRIEPVRPVGQVMMCGMRCASRSVGIRRGRGGSSVEGAMEMLFHERVQWTKLPLWRF